MHLKNELVLLRGPLSPDNRGINDVMPPFAALSAKSPREISRNDNPVLGSVVVDLLSEDPILFLGPLVARANLFDLLGLRKVLRAAWLVLRWIQRQPSFETSDLCLVDHELAESMPGVFAVDLD